MNPIILLIEDDPDSIKRDVIKNLKRLLGNNSSLVQQVEFLFKEIDNKLSQKEMAAKILEVLNNLPIGQKLLQVYGNYFETSEKLFKEKLAPKIGASLISTLTGKYTNFTSSLSPQLKVAVKGGAIAGVFSGIGHSWRVFQGEETAGEALQYVLKDTTLSTASLYMSEGVIQKLGGGKYAITVIVQEGASASAKQIGAALNFGIATFIFDETTHIYHYLTGGMNPNEFINLTSKSVLKAAASGSAVYCAVLFGASAGGPVVMAVSIGTYIAVNTTNSYFEEINSRKFLTYRDLLLLFPSGINNKLSLLEINEVYDPNLLDLNTIKGETLLDINNEKDTTIDGYLKKGKSGILLDF